MPNDVPTGIERINLIKSVVGYLLEELKNKGCEAREGKK